MTGSMSNHINHPSAALVSKKSKAVYASSFNPATRLCRVNTGIAQASDTANPTTANIKRRSGIDTMNLLCNNDNASFLLQAIHIQGSDEWLLTADKREDAVS